MLYNIKKADHKITSPYDKAWNSAEIAKIDNVNWKDYPYKPNTTGRVLYSDYGIHVQLITDEQPLLARYTEQNSDVYRDSCKLVQAVQKAVFFCVFKL